jgi:hypothetical protein
MQRLLLIFGVEKLAATLMLCLAAGMMAVIIEAL